MLEYTPAAASAGVPPSCCKCGRVHVMATPQMSISQMSADLEHKLQEVQVQRSSLAQRQKELQDEQAEQFLSATRDTMTPYEKYTQNRRVMEHAGLNRVDEALKKRQEQLQQQLKQLQQQQRRSKRTVRPRKAPRLLSQRAVDEPSTATASSSCGVDPTATGSGGGDASRVDLTNASGDEATGSSGGDASAVDLTNASGDEATGSAGGDADNDMSSQLDRPLPGMTLSTRHFAPTFMEDPDIPERSADV